MTSEPVLVAAYDDCLTSLAAGHSLEACLARHTALQSELRPILAYALAASAMGTSISVPRQAEMTSLLTFMARSADWPPSRPSRPGWMGLLMPRLVTLILVLVLGAITGTYGVVVASRQSVPGDLLYGVKRTVEQTELLLASDPQSRADLQVEFDERRVAEVQTVTMQKRRVQIEFSGRLESIQGESWTVARVTVVLSSRTRILGSPIAGVLVSVAGVSQEDGTVLASQVTVDAEDSGTPTPEALLASATPAPTQTAGPISSPPPASATSVPGAVATTPAAGEDVEFIGVVEAMTVEVWRIGGQDVGITAETEIRGSPLVGQTVEVKAKRMPNGGLIARRIKIKEPSPEPKASNTPKPSKTPEASKTPEPSKTPQPSHTHRPSSTQPPSKTLVPSATPEPSDTPNDG